MARCEHMNFKATVAVGRISETEGGPITSYCADVRVECAGCGLKFRFVGLPYGYHFRQPTLSIDGTELRAVLEPAHVVEIAGHPLVAGTA